MSHLFWLSDTHMARLRPFFPKSYGKPRADDRRVLRGIIFINRNGLRWSDAPKEYGPHKTLYNRWKRWSEMGCSPGFWAIYSSRDYLARHDPPASVEDLHHYPLIAFDESLARHRLSVWLRDVTPNARYAVRSDSVLGLVSAARLGVGIAALPIALGDAEPDLVRILPPVPALTRAWRLLTHPDARHLQRVEAFFDFVGEEVANLQPVLSG